MQPERRVPTHPGEILLEEFLVPMGQTQVALACMRLAERSSMRAAVVSITLSQASQFDDCASLR